LRSSSTSAMRMARGVTVTLVDLRAERGPFTLTLSPAALEVPDVLVGTVCTWNAETLLQAPAAGNGVSMTLPGFADAAGVVVLREGC